MRKWRGHLIFLMVFGSLSFIQCNFPTQSSNDITNINRDKHEASPLAKSSSSNNTEVVFWDAVGYGSSSFGHVSVNIYPDAFSWGPGGMWRGSASTYMATNQLFRGGTGLVLNLSNKESENLKDHLYSYQDKADYNLLWKNCTDPIEVGLESLGYNLGCNLTPQQLQSAIERAGLVVQKITYNKDNDLPLCGSGVGVAKEGASKECNEQPTLPPSTPVPWRPIGGGGGGGYGFTGEFDVPPTCWEPDGSFRWNKYFRSGTVQVEDCKVNTLGFRFLCTELTLIRFRVCNESVYHGHPYVGEVVSKGYGIENKESRTYPELKKGRRR